MRFSRFALVASALVLGACAGEEAPATDAAVDAAAPAAEAPATTAAAAPVTGTVHDVRAVFEDGAYKFVPANITIAQGDGVRFLMESGMPHNVAFENVPAAAQAQLDANIPASEKLGTLATRMYVNTGEEVTISFANVPAGTYNYTCTPHKAMGMNGVITVQ